MSRAWGQLRLSYPHKPRCAFPLTPSLSRANNVQCTHTAFRALVCETLSWPFNVVANAPLDCPVSPLPHCPTASLLRSRRFWEVEELVRKLLLSAVVVLIEPGSPLQVTLAVLVCSWAHVLHAAYQPWGRGSVMYTLQHGSLFVTSFVFLMVRVTVSPIEPSVTRCRHAQAPHRPML